MSIRDLRNRQAEMAGMLSAAERSMGLTRLDASGQEPDIPWGEGDSGSAENAAQDGSNRRERAVPKGWVVVFQDGHELEVGSSAGNEGHARSIALDCVQKQRRNFGRVVKVRRL